MITFGKQEYVYLIFIFLIFRFVVLPLYKFYKKPELLYNSMLYKELKFYFSLFKVEYDAWKQRRKNKKCLKN